VEEGILLDLITVASRFLRASDASFDLLGHATRERKGAVYEKNDRNRARSREHRAGQQEAFQLLQNAAGIFYALAYLAMFALPLIGRQKEIARPALWLQAVLFQDSQ